MYKLSIGGIHNMFKIKGESIIVDAPILEVYLPDDYPAAELYSIVGVNTKWFAIGNFKVFKNEKELEHRDKVPTRPIAIATFLLSRPSEVDFDDVAFVSGGYARKCLIMRFYKNDVFAVNRNIIKSADSMSIFMNRLDAGKLDNIPPEIMPGALRFAQELNNVNLSLPEEHLEAMMSDRLRDPNNQKRLLRHATEDTKGEVVSITPREDAMTSTTFQGFTFEDVNSSLIVACNRKAAGVKDEATIMEKIIRGEKIEKP